MQRHGHERHTARRSHALTSAAALGAGAGRAAACGSREGQAEREVGRQRTASGWQQASRAGRVHMGLPSSHNGAQHACRGRGGAVVAAACTTCSSCLFPMPDARVHLCLRRHLGPQLRLREEGGRPGRMSRTIPWRPRLLRHCRRSRQSRLGRTQSCLRKQISGRQYACQETSCQEQKARQGGSRCAAGRHAWLKRCWRLAGTQYGSPFPPSPPSPPSAPGPQALPPARRRSGAGLHCMARRTAMLRCLCHLEPQCNTADVGPLRKPHHRHRCHLHLCKGRRAAEVRAGQSTTSGKLTQLHLASAQHSGPSGRTVAAVGAGTVGAATVSACTAHQQSGHFTVLFKLARVLREPAAAASKQQCTRVQPSCQVQQTHATAPSPPRPPELLQSHS